MCNREPILSSEGLAKDLINIFLKIPNGLYIIIDGLDECPPREEGHIIDYFQPWNYPIFKHSQHESQSRVQWMFTSIRFVAGWSCGKEQTSPGQGVPKID